MARKMGSYRLGRAREYRAMERLRRMGAIHVKRSYGSHGLFDIYAIFPTGAKLIQVKKGSISREEAKRLVEFARLLKAGNLSVELWTYEGGRLRIKRV